MSPSSQPTAAQNRNDLNHTKGYVEQDGLEAVEPNDFTIKEPNVPIPPLEILLMRIVLVCVLPFVKL